MLINENRKIMAKKVNVAKINKYNTHLKRNNIWYIIQIWLR